MSETLKPGVVTGEDYKTLVSAAKAGQYALPAVNVVGTNSVSYTHLTLPTILLV